MSNPYEPFQPPFEYREELKAIVDKDGFVVIKYPAILVPRLRERLAIGHRIAALMNKDAKESQ